MSSSIVDRLRAGPVLGAEGYVFELERRGYIKALTDLPCKGLVFGGTLLFSVG